MNVLTGCRQYEELTGIRIDRDNRRNLVNVIFLTPSLSSFHPFPFLMCCAILPTLFGGKGPHLRRLLVTPLSSDGLLPQVFRGIHQPQIQEICALPPVSSHYHP